MRRSRRIIRRRREANYDEEERLCRRKILTLRRKRAIGRGYWKVHVYNTQTALHRVVDDWLDNVSDGNLTGVCSFDITKCFDTINHAILLKNMSFYGFNYHTSKWFQ